MRVNPVSGQFVKMTSLNLGSDLNTGKKITEKTLPTRIGYSGQHWQKADKVGQNIQKTKMQPSNAAKIEARRIQR
jgi:hypothetical protein